MSSNVLVASDLAESGAEKPSDLDCIRTRRNGENYATHKTKVY